MTGRCGDDALSPAVITAYANFIPCDGDVVVLLRDRVLAFFLGLSPIGRSETREPRLNFRLAFLDGESVASPTTRLRNTTSLSYSLCHSRHATLWAHANTGSRRGPDPLSASVRARRRPRCCRRHYPLHGFSLSSRVDMARSVACTLRPRTVGNDIIYIPARPH